MSYSDVIDCLIFTNLFPHAICDALGVLADNWVTLLITDITMPGVDGLELARQAKVMHLTSKVIYLSGAS